MKKIHVVLFLLVLCGIGVYSCNSAGGNKFEKDIEAGYQLAQTHCKSCHQLPDPALLNKATWVNYVLPKMGGFVGFQYLGLNHYVENGYSKIMKLEEWDKIIQYYTTQSPTDPAKGESKNIPLDLQQFNVQIPSFGVRQPATTLVYGNNPDSGLYFGDGIARQLYSLNINKQAVDSFPVSIGISNLHIDSSSLLALTMGVMLPSDRREGKLVSINKFNKKAVVILDSLQRPVHATYTDLNNDNLQDIIICEFGNRTGQLSWFQNTGNHKYIKHTLRPLPGAIHTEVYDFNTDGRPDIMAMMAQGDEGIFIYYNQGNNTFKEERILQLPPSYGSNYFELVDINKDGFPDIIATNGDNGDYPPILKAYHGIRIYLNDGRNNFKEKIFLHVNGIGKAIAKDFDGDGDIDIASIAFFADFNNTPQEGFIYWENKGQLDFKASSFKEATAGRWLTMDAADIDNDGDIDIVLGNANFQIGDMPEVLKKKLDSYSPSVLILKNKLH